MSDPTRIARDLAVQRDQMHSGHPNSRQFAGRVQEIGLLGEFEFGRFCGQWPDLVNKPQGDRGVDFRVPVMLTVDVKTARNPSKLLVIQKEKLAEIFVLAHFDERSEQVRLVGWCWRDQVLEAPTEPSKDGQLTNYVVPAASLFPMAWLEQRICRIRQQGASL